MPDRRRTSAIALRDVFCIRLAMTVVMGLSFGTLLMLPPVPVLYAALYRLVSAGLTQA
ncbi:MAG: hypothetical protein ACU85U_19675 [Gammaproteobacteria bacterium]